MKFWNLFSLTGKRKGKNKKWAEQLIEYWNDGVLWKEHVGLGCNPSAAQAMYSLISYIISLRHSFPSVKWGQYLPCLTHLIDGRIKMRSVL